MVGDRRHNKVLQANGTNKTNQLIVLHSVIVPAIVKSNRTVEGVKEFLSVSTSIVVAFVVSLSVE